MQQVDREQMKNQMELLNILWRQEYYDSLTSTTGEHISIKRWGEYDPQRGVFMGAEIESMSTIFRGDIAPFGDDHRGEYVDLENCILVVSAAQTLPFLRQDGSAVMQAVIDIDPLHKAAYESLKDGASSFGCAGHLSRMDSLHRVNVFTRLVLQRLQRKCGDIEQMYEEGFQNWNEAMYMLLFMTMGQPRNKEPFRELSKRVRYSMVSRERNSIQHVEALLLGASGLLELYHDDIYIRELKENFEYLRNKYGIIPMRAGEWVISSSNPNNHPVVRMAQLSMFIASEEFIFDKITQIDSVQQIQQLFRTEASQYWSTHYIPGKKTEERPKRIGYEKANIMGINMVVPLIMAFGDFVGDEEMKRRGMELLDKIISESNTIVNGWKRGGVVVESAFDSQALIQLNNEYCARRECWICPIGRKIILDISRRQT